MVTEMYRKFKKLYDREAKHLSILEHGHLYSVYQGKLLGIVEASYMFLSKVEVDRLLTNYIKLIK